MFLAKVYVTLKPTVNDPQGITVMDGLRALGFETVEDLRIGKYMEIRLNAPDAETASSNVRDMCQKLLANPVIEQFRFDLEDAPSKTTN